MKDADSASWFVSVTVLFHWSFSRGFSSSFKVKGNSYLQKAVLMHAKLKVF